MPDTPINDETTPLPPLPEETVHIPESVLRLAEKLDIKAEEVVEVVYDLVEHKLKLATLEALHRYRPFFVKHGLMKVAQTIIVKAEDVTPDRTTVARPTNGKEPEKPTQAETETALGKEPGPLLPEMRKRGRPPKTPHPPGSADGSPPSSP